MHITNLNIVITNLNAVITNLKLPLNLSLFLFFIHTKLILPIIIGKQCYLFFSTYV